MPTPVDDGIIIDPGTQTGAPVAGTWFKGTIIVDATATPYVCTVAGTPGTWVPVGLGTIPVQNFVEQFPEFIDTFVNGIQAPWVQGITGSSTVAQIAPPAGAGGKTDVVGVLAATTGNATNSYIGYILGASLLRFDSPSKFTLCMRINLPALAVNGNDFTLIAGFTDSNAATPVDGVFFEYNRVSNGGDFWSLNAMSNSSRTRQILAVAPLVNTWYDLTIDVDAGANNAKFSIDGVQVGTAISTNIPTGAGRETSIGFRIGKVSGAALRAVYLDYIYLKRNRT